MGSGKLRPPGTCVRPLPPGLKLASSIGPLLEGEDAKDANDGSEAGL
jgi:hypothetical protein